MVELQDRVVDLKKENDNLRYNPVPPQVPQVIEKEVPTGYNLTISVKEKGLFGGSHRFVKLTIKDGSFVIQDDENRVYVDSIEKI